LALEVEVEVEVGNGGCEKHWLVLVIHDLKIYWTEFGPAKANSPLVIHSDGVEATPFLLFDQRLKAVAGRNLEVIKNSSGIQL
jgi:hypothetical protein